MISLRPRSSFGLVTALSVLLTGGGALAQQATLERVKRIGEIKVCVDQNNLPYSSDKPDVPGFDVEMAREIAKELGLKLGYNWFATNNGKRALRQMVGEGNCDFFLGLPLDESFEDSNFKLILSKPYYVGGFATLTRADAPATVLADSKAKGVGVQLGTFADFKLFNKGFERKLYKNATEMFEAVVHKEIDAAVTPAPEGAWLVKSSGDARLKILPNTEKEFMFPMGIAVRKADKDLKEVINTILDKLAASGKTKEIFAKYGMVELVAEGGAPQATDAKAPEPKTEAAPAKAPEAPAPAAPAAADKKSEAAPAPAAPAAAAPAAAPAAATATPAAPAHELAVAAIPSTDPEFPNDPVTLDKGRKMYKQACYKCHGPNVVSGGTLPDLRLFAGDEYEMFAVVQAGRLEKGMPKWGDYLSIEEIKQVVVYVKDVTVKTKHELLEHSNRH